MSTQSQRRAGNGLSHKALARFTRFCIEMRAGRDDAVESIGPRSACASQAGYPGKMLGLAGDAARALPTLAIASAAGWVAKLAHVPLPWMIGPLFAVAALRIAGLPLPRLPGGRELGQWVIGTALGLYFTPSVVGTVLGIAPLIVIGGLFAIGIGYLSGCVLSRLGGVDFATAFFASVPGGASEMAFLGERHGARIDRVAAGQSMRILLVVAIVPGAYQWLGVHGADRYVAGVASFSLPGFALLGALTGAGGAVVARMRVGNAWVIGPLAVAIPLTAAGVELSAVPTVLSNAAQVMLGSALASRFAPGFVRSSGSYLPAVIVSVGLALAVSVAGGLALAATSGIHWTTMVLATAPGGIAEMALTARALDLGVPIVTAFHVTRLAMLVLFVGPVYALTGRRARREREI